MNLALWIVAIVLAATFATSGILKVTRSREQLIPLLPYVEDLSLPTVRIIGAAELLGAIGLVLPATIGVAPMLTPLAASGLALIMMLAIITHLRRHDGPATWGFNLVLLAGALFVAWGRFGPYAF